MTVFQDIIAQQLQIQLLELLTINVQKLKQKIRHVQALMNAKFFTIVSQANA